MQATLVTEDGTWPVKAIWTGVNFLGGDAWSEVFLEGAKSFCKIPAIHVVGDTANTYIYT